MSTAKLHVHEPVIKGRCHLDCGQFETRLFTTIPPHQAETPSATTSE